MMQRLLVLSLVALATACSPSGQVEGGHAHDEGGHAHDDHGGHGAEYPTEAVTVWTDKAELFMEWEVLTVGRESRFLAHLTDMTDPEAFKAVASGSVTVTLAVEGQAPTAWRVDEPARLGIFIPSVVPKVAGKCKLSVTLASESLSETFDVSPCVVYPDEASAKASPEDAEPAGQISFLKEQQWPIAFATVEAKVGDLTPSTTINASTRAVPGHEAKLTAPTAGRLVLADPVPTLGSAVEEGQVLAQIQPTVSVAANIGTLQADVTAAKAELQAAQSAKERLERLVATDSVPKRRLEEAESALAVARAEWQAARTRLSAYRASAGGTSRATAGAFRITAPLSGTLVDHAATEGETVSPGSHLFSVIDLDRLWIEGRVFEPDVPKFEGAQRAWFTVDGREQVFQIDGETGHLVTLGHVLDPQSRTVSVVYEVHNPEQKIRVGQFARLSVATGPTREALLIPEAALVQDGNQSIVFVHASGEAFERRVVRVGQRSQGFVEVLSGVVAGERVATVGAYDIKLAASAGGAPAHGHAH